MCLCRLALIPGNNVQALTQLVEFMTGDVNSLRMVLVFLVLTLNLPHPVTVALDSSYLSSVDMENYEVYIGRKGIGM